MGVGGEARHVEEWAPEKLKPGSASLMQVKLGGVPFVWARCCGEKLTELREDLSDVRGLRHCGGWTRGVVCDARDREMVKESKSMSELL